MKYKEQKAKLQMERILKTIPLTQNTCVFHDEILYNNVPIIISEGVSKNEDLNLQDYSLKSIGVFRFVSQDFIEKWRTDVAFLPSVQLLPYTYFEKHSSEIPINYINDDLFSPEGEIYPKLTNFSYQEKITDEIFHIDAVYNYLKQNPLRFKNIQKHTYWKSTSGKNKYLEFDWIPNSSEYKKYIDLVNSDSINSLNEVYKILGIDKFLRYDPLNELKKASK